MSKRIYNECNFIDKKNHTPEDCTRCIHPGFWDEAYKRVMSELRPIPQGA